MLSCCDGQKNDDINLEKLDKYQLPNISSHAVSNLKGFFPYGSPGYADRKKGGWTDENLNPQPVKGVSKDANNRNYPVKPDTWHANVLDYDPCCFVVCFSAEDVVCALDYYRANLFGKGPFKSRLAICCGRHSNYAWEEGAFVLDVTGMNSISIDADTETVTVGAGCLAGNVLNALKDFNKDHTQGKDYNYVVLTGNAYDVGVSGHCLAGGAGFLYRLRGMMCDSLQSCKVVTANGDVLNVSAQENPDLLAGVKGSGGNFGVVTEFVLKLQKIPKRVFCNQRVMLPLGMLSAPDRFSLLKKHCAFMAKADAGVSSYLVSVAGGPVIELMVNSKFAVDNSSDAACPVVSQQVTEYVTTENSNWAQIPPAKILNDMDYFEFMEQNELGGAKRTIGHDILVGAMTDELIAVLDKYTNGSVTTKGKENAFILYCMTPDTQQRPAGTLLQSPDYKSTVFDRASQASMKGCRSAHWMIIIMGSDEDQEWTDAMYKELHPFALGGYAGNKNFADPKSAAYMKSDECEQFCYGDNLKELKKLKAKLDAQNMFQMNNNIKP